MTSYECMIKVNHELIKGREIDTEQKNIIVSQFLSDRSTSEQAKSFMYPMFFIPPHEDGKKFKTILGQTPKTQIFSANMYELEILRLLYLFAPENVEVKNMISGTLERLKTTCFGYMDDGVGECFDTSLIVLRFLVAVAQEEMEWIMSRMENYNRHFGDKKRPWFSEWYYWLCLSEMPFDIAYPEIEKYKDEIRNRLINRSYVMNSEKDKQIHPVILCILRNILAKYPEYEYIKARQPYVNEKDGRLYFDMS